MTRNPEAAQHLAEIDAQHDAHVAALRARAAAAADAIAERADDLAEHFEPHPSDARKNP